MAEKNAIGVGAVTDANADLFSLMLREDPDGLRALLKQANWADDSIDNVIKITKNREVERAKRETLREFKDDFTKNILEAANDLVDGGFIPKEVTKAEIRLKYTSTEETMGSGQVVQPGFHVIRFDAQTDDMEKMLTLSSIAKSSPKAGGGNGGRRAIELPEGISSWAAYWRETYPDDAAKYEGKSINCTIRLKALKDETYLNAVVATNGTKE